MPSKAKSKKPAKKAARSVAPKSRKAVAPKRAKPATARRDGIDPRIVAAIGLALRDEEVASERAAQLESQLSPWTALGRVRAVRTR